MIIDFHTHIFPEKIAKKTIEYLSEKGGIPPFSDGSFSGLLSELEKAQVDIAVNLPVVTDPKQFESITRFASEINATKTVDRPKVISFAGIHPKCEDIEEKMAFIAGSGFIGIKLHPDYQRTYFDDDGYVRIIRMASELDLIVTTHAGIDIGGTLIGMQLREVAVPIRLSVKTIGKANILCAYTRPKYIGGSRAQYEEN